MDVFYLVGLGLLVWATVVLVGAFDKLKKDQPR
jgi:hypothetical protein